MEFKAIGNKVIIKVIKEETKQNTTDSGIIFMDKVKNGLDVNTIEAEVVSVGEGYVHERTGEHIKVPLEIGDRVVINGAVGAPLDENHRTINADDIFAKIVK